MNFQKKFFLDDNFFFQEQKKIVQGTTFVKFFMYWKAKKKKSIFEKKIFQKLLSKFSKIEIFKKFRITLKFFFALQYISYQHISNGFDYKGPSI